MTNTSRIKPLKDAELVNGTSFHSHTITATPRILCELLGDPFYEDHIGRDKVRMEWLLEIDGNPVTLYDWKYYEELNMDEKIIWHIGGKSWSVTSDAQDALIALLYELKA